MILKLEKLFIASDFHYITGTFISGNVETLYLPNDACINGLLSLLFKLSPIYSGSITINDIAIDFFDRTGLSKLIKVATEFDKFNKKSGYEYLEKNIDRRNETVIISKDDIKDLIPDLCFTMKIDEDILSREVSGYNYLEILQLKLLDSVTCGAKIFIVDDSKNKVDADILKMLVKFSRRTDILVLILTNDDSL